MKQSASSPWSTNQANQKNLYLRDSYGALGDAVGLMGCHIALLIGACLHMAPCAHRQQRLPSLLAAADQAIAVAVVRICRSVHASSTATASQVLTSCLSRALCAHFRKGKTSGGSCHRGPCGASPTCPSRYSSHGSGPSPTGCCYHCCARMTRH
jgi:hypothetical protein